MTVQEQIEALGWVDPVLFQQTLLRDAYQISYDSTNATLAVQINGAPPTILTVTEEVDGRTSWTATVVTINGKGRATRNRKTEENHSGWVMTTGESFVFQIKTTEGVYRLETPLFNESNIAGSEPIGPPGVGSCATCGCRNADGTGSCTDEECDKSDGCGTTNTGTCTWVTPVVVCN